MRGDYTIRSIRSELGAPGCKGSWESTAWCGLTKPARSRHCEWGAALHNATVLSLPKDGKAAGSAAIHESGNLSGGERERTTFADKGANDDALGQYRYGVVAGSGSVEL